MLIMKLFCQGKYKLNTVHINDSQIASLFFRQAHYRKIFYQIIDQLNNEYTDLLQTLEEKLKYFICLWPSKISKKLFSYRINIYYDHFVNLH